MLLALEDVLIRRRYHQVGSVPLRQHDVSGFVVMGHPYNFQHLVRIFRMFKPDIYNVTEDFLLKIFELAPSYHSTDIKNFRSAAGQVVDGHFVMCPIIPDMTLLKP